MRDYLSSLLQDYINNRFRTDDLLETLRQNKQYGFYTMCNLPDASVEKKQLILNASLLLVRNACPSITNVGIGDDELTSVVRKAIGSGHIVLKDALRLIELCQS